MGWNKDVEAFVGATWPVLLKPADAGIFAGGPVDQWVELPVATNAGWDNKGITGLLIPGEPIGGIWFPVDENGVETFLESAK